MILSGLSSRLAVGLAIGICSLLALSGCSDEPQLLTITGFAQGTTYNISYWTADSVPAETVEAHAEQVLEKIDVELSTYRDDSDIVDFNNSRVTEAQVVPASLVDLVRIAKTVSAQSHGCYDLTIRPLFTLWGFDGTFRVPSASAVEETRRRIGMDRLTIAGPTLLAKAEADIGIDVSSIAQGYSTALLAAALEDLGITNYLVEVGGELLVKGGKPGGEDWRVAIERPLAGERAIQKIVEIEPGGALSVVTSGTYRHYYDEAGKRYSHILDARTGSPVTHDLLSVTVIHPDPTIADAWSTALLCLGTKAALEVSRKLDMAVMLVEADGDEWREHFSPAFENPRWQVQAVPE
ncbi:FAD:protein FMN transferase [Hydrocarboniclastica marina]|uniref:FAD:protein FMN transferase n=1 Tax=Hydrocarboniclastica marina TaxID=2259620 RepID=A0A4P7XHQ3_9ALTE|nr:FAD:protein FMN transferase [Hydrocarboniclastica marina]